MIQFLLFLARAIVLCAAGEIILKYRKAPCFMFHVVFGQAVAWSESIYPRRHFRNFRSSGKSMERRQEEAVEVQHIPPTRAN